MKNPPRMCVCASLLFINARSIFLFSFFSYTAGCRPGVFAGSGDDGRPSREETERKSSTSASPFCNYHLRKREREREKTI